MNTDTELPGHLGQAFGRIAQALGMNVLACDDNQDKRPEGPNLRYATLDEIYALSDVISLHCSLFESNIGMINMSAIAQMKPGVLLINTSCDPLIVEQDLAEALATGKLAGAALDVLSVEPPQADNPLFTAPNCIITPHIAWATKEARMRLTSIAVENLAKLLKGSPRNVVNP